VPEPAQRPGDRTNVQPPQMRQPAQQPQIRQVPQSQVARPTPHAFSPREGNFDPRVSGQRGQASRQAPQTRSAPQPRGQKSSAPAQRGGDRRNR
jgi:hypothetical protein